GAVRLGDRVVFFLGVVGPVALQVAPLEVDGVFVLGQGPRAEPGFLVVQELLEELVDCLVWLAVFHRILNSRNRLCSHSSYPKRPRRPRPSAQALPRLPPYPSQTNLSRGMLHLVSVLARWRPWTGNHGG